MKLRIAGIAWKRLLPFLVWLPQTTRDSLRADISAGLTNAVIVLPQGVAFAIVAGLPIQFGLYTAVVTATVAALFGSSRHMISGPTMAISILVFATLSKHAVPGTPEYISFALTLTFLAGAYQLAFGLGRLGALVNFVSPAVVVGFTAGAAILIATSQMKHMLGVTLEPGVSFLHVVGDLIASAPDTELYVVAVALLTLTCALAVRHYRPNWPYMLIAMLAGSVLAVGLSRLGAEVALVGELPAGLPPPTLPGFSLDAIRRLAPDALAVALLGLIEASAIARSIASRSGQRLDGNQEFVGQGLSNVVGSFFSCFAGSGSFTRSALNYDAGARSPLSGIFAAIAVIVILLTIAPIFAWLPVAAVAAIILVVAWNLIEFAHIRSIMRASRTETIVLGITFGATLLLDLEFAIFAGVFFSLVFYLTRTTRPKVFSLAPDPDDPKRRFNTFEVRTLPECPQLKMVRIDGSLFFGSVDHVERALQFMSDRSPEQNHMLIVASGINFVDVAGAEMLVREAKRWRSLGGELYLCGMKKGPYDFLRQGGFLDTIGEENIFSTKAHAIARIFVTLDRDTCVRCTKRIFTECREVPSPGDETGETGETGEKKSTASTKDGTIPAQGA